MGVKVYMQHVINKICIICDFDMAVSSLKNLFFDGVLMKSKSFYSFYLARWYAIISPTIKSSKNIYQYWVDSGCSRRYLIYMSLTEETCKVLLWHLLLQQARIDTQRSVSLRLSTRSSCNKFAPSTIMCIYHLSTAKFKIRDSFGSNNRAVTKSFAETLAWAFGCILTNEPGVYEPTE